MAKPPKTINKQCKKPTEVSVAFSERKLLWMIAIPVFVFMIYKPVSKYDMINWDEKRYLLETPAIKALTIDNFKEMFTQKVLLSYNPIMLLSFAIDYKIAKNDYGWFHLVNVFFHLLNCLLLFACLRKLRLRTSAAGLITALFAFNPLAVEAVAWIAARKDVLYVFFYFLSWFFYLKFSESRKKLFYFIAFLFGLLSLFSKVQAVSLPFLFLLSDYLLDKKITTKGLINKIPFVILSLAFGLYAISGSTLVADKYSIPPTFLDKIMYSIMAFGMYVENLFIPIGLSVIHQFPIKGSSEYIIAFIMGIFFIAVFLYVIIRFFKKAPYVTIGLLFFSIHIFIVLHIVAYNSALIYERFTYVAAIGIFLSLVRIDEIFPSWEKYRTQLLVPFVLVLMFVSYQRIPVWQNGETLWTDAIAKEPRAEQAYNNRGQFYDANGRYEDAFADFSASIKIDRKKPDAWNNLSVYYFRKADWENALKINDTVLTIEPRSIDGLSNRGGIFFNQQLYDSAIYWYSRLAEVSPKFSSAYYNLGASYFKLKKFTQARDNFKLAIQYYPRYVKAYTFQGLTYARLDQPDSAIYISEKVEALDPSAGSLRAAGLEYISMGNETYNNGDPARALRYYLTAGKVNPLNAESYYDAGGVYLMMKNIPQARECWKKCLSINPYHKEALAWIEKTK